MSSNGQQGIRAVLFDAVGTLIRTRRPVAESYREFGVRHGFDVTAAEISDRFRRALERQTASAAAARSCRTSERDERLRWRRIVAEVFDVQQSEALDRLFEDLWEYFAKPDNWQLYDDVPSVWSELTTLGLTLGVASNLDQRLRQFAAHLPVLSDCPHLFISSEIGFRKPSKPFFLNIQRALRLQPAQLLLVGDEPLIDIAAARACGWQAVLLDRTMGHPETGSISDLRELLAVLSLR